jgi:gliding motility-associated-like protein
VVNSSGCENLGEIQLHIEPIPSFDFDDTYLLCTDNPALSLTGPDGFDAYGWLKMEGNTEQLISTAQIMDILEIGNYRLETTRIISQNGETLSCTSSTDFEVLPSNPAEITAIIVKDITANNTIEVEVSGDGDYEFSLDGNIFQDSNFFENVASGFVTVYVQDKNGCGLVEETVEIDPDLTSGGFPNFFTPNGDGINDFWQFIPSGDEGDIDVKTIHIYNRLGHLMALLDPRSQGWDGTFKGRPVAASDYWFKAISYNNQVIQGHFTLKR